MRGVDSLVLNDTEYTLSPVNQGLSGLMDMAKSVTATPEGGHEVHLLDVVDSDGTQVLAVKAGGQMTTAAKGLFKSLDRWYAFETPDSERLLILECEEQWWPPGDQYTLQGASTGSVLATWKRASVLRQKWRLDTPGGETAAIASRPWQRTLRELVPFSRSKTFAVTAPRGSEVARIQILESGLMSLKGREVEVTLKESLIPGEILLAFAVALRMEVADSGDGGDGGE